MAGTPERYHSLDALRGFAMFLGLILHSLISFNAQPLPYWPAHDSRRDLLSDQINFAIHGFRMELFFLMAGFFGALVLSRKGLGHYVRGRATRIGIPLLLGVLLIQPTLQIVWMFGRPEACLAYNYPLPPADRSMASAVFDYLFSVSFLKHWKELHSHLWFLHYLLIMIALTAAVALLTRHLPRPRFVDWLDGKAGALFASPLQIFALAIPATILRSQMPDVIVRAGIGWLPPAIDVAYYYFFYAVGFLLYRHRERLKAFAAPWPFMLVAANLLLLPMASPPFIRLLLANSEPGSAHLVTRYLESLYCWMMIVGLTGLFMRLFRGESRVVRYCADASYWCYLMGLTPLVALQIWIAPYDWPFAVKVLILNGVTLALLLVSYEWCVRYTKLGVLLHGRRVRPSHSEGGGSGGRRAPGPRQSRDAPPVLSVT